MTMLMKILTVVDNMIESFFVDAKLLKSGQERNGIVVERGLTVMNWRFFAAVCANNNKFGR